MRDLALFNVAIDSKLRDYDVLALNVDDLAPGGNADDRATVRQKKDWSACQIELKESTRQAIDDYLRITGKRSGEYLEDTELAASIIGTHSLVELTAQLQGNVPTGAASARSVREFKFHPDFLKLQKGGEATVVDKDRGRVFGPVLIRATHL